MSTLPTLSRLLAAPLCLSLVLAALPARLLSADDDPQPASPGQSQEPDGKKDDKKKKDGKKKEKKEADSADRYQVPEQGLDELRQFIVGLLRFEPSSQQEAIEHQQKVVPAIRTAANRILEQDENATSDFSKMANAVLLQLDIQDLRTGDAEPQAVVDKSLKFVTSIGEGTGGFEVQLLMALGETLERIGKDQQAIAVYRKGSDLLAKSDSDQVKEYAKLMAGMARRLDLPGKVLKVEGSTYSGEEFALKDLRGKVVLVDFWATWCGPCLREIPNMLANYKRFHDKGFEIVGVSLDEDRQALEEFLQQRELPWIILHEKDGSGHPAATYYGVRGIPAMFLVGPDGRVLSTNARGPALTQILEEQYPGTPELKEEEEEAEPGAE